MSALNKFLAEVRHETDRRLDEALPPGASEPRRLHEAIRWSVFAGGKRLRPAIVIAVGNTFGAPLPSLLNTAAAVEMIHTYSLIHDDLPAMDDDDLRRGRATCHKRFGEATAILAGDALQALAFKTIASDGVLTTADRVNLIEILAAAAATPAGMVSGQQLDLDAEGKSVSIDELERIHSQKTGALISACARAGAIIGGASVMELEVIEQYAGKLGLLFQITDDLLDVTQETVTLGKTAGKDAAAKKATYPRHYGVEKTRAMADDICDQTRETLTALSKDTGLLRDLADLIANRIR